MTQTEFNTVSGFYFDTYNTISAYGEPAILQAAMQRCQYYNDLLSKTVAGSDVWRINHAEGEPVKVSAHTLTILRAAEQVSAASEGAFNIAVGPAVALWRFKDEQPHLPDPQALAEAVARAEYQKILLDEAPGDSLSGDNLSVAGESGAVPTVTVPAGMQIDLGGIAKGYIADCIADELRQQGIRSALLNFGGNVVTIGSKPDGAPWSIGLQTPDGERGKTFWAAVKCVDGTVVTSGVYERGFEIDGVRYHHILDPRTGWPVQNGLLTVTVCTQSSLWADVLTTAMFVLGVEAGMKLAHRFGVQAVFLARDGKISYTQGLDLTLVRPQ